MRMGKGSGSKGFEGNETAAEGGLGSGKHVAEAARYVKGDVDGVSVETGWDKKTKHTGKYDEA